MVSSSSRLRGCAIALCAFLGAGLAQANGYTIYDLGHYRLPSDVNDAGDIPGYDHALWNYPSPPLVRRDGKWRELSEEKGVANTIDGDGTVGGVTNFGDEGHATATTWSPDGAAHFFTFSGGSIDSTVMDVSHGQVVGYFFPTQFGSAICFKASSQGGVVTTLGTFLDKPDCVAAGINASGQIVGLVRDRARDSVAFILRDGVFTALGILAGGTESAAGRINDAGHVIGNSWDPSIDFERGFFWKDGVLTDIAKSSHAIQTRAQAINNQDVIVGQASYASGRRHRAVRFEGGHAIDLQKEVVNIAGWNLRIATGVNDLGVIVGWGLYLGQQRGFMLVPTKKH